MTLKTATLGKLFSYCELPCTLEKYFSLVAYNGLRDRVLDKNEFLFISCRMCRKIGFAGLLCVFHVASAFIIYPCLVWKAGKLIEPCLTSLA